MSRLKREKLEEMKEHKEKRAHGGGIMPHAEHRGHRKVKVTKKSGGKVHGKKPHHRLDRRARGGGAGPFSEAEKIKEPHFAHGHLGKDNEGAGKERKSYRD